LAKNAVVLRYVMPAYIGISGLIIFMIECRIGFVVRNMRFFYNYFGRGLFNIYAGVMPMTMIANFDNSLSAFEIVTLVGSSVMTLVGLLYISLKVFCCEKEGE
jgi:COPI associated protein